MSRLRFEQGTNVTKSGMPGICQDRRREAMLRP
jgi:hypothetical protein